MANLRIPPTSARLNVNDSCMHKQAYVAKFTIPYFYNSGPTWVKNVIDATGMCLK